MPSNTSLTVAVIGVGHLHPRLYMSLFEQVDSLQPVAAVERDAGLRRAFCSDYCLEEYDSVESMLEKLTPDVAAIFLPHDECPDAADLCARAGAHLMVEKPMASSSDGARRIVESARSAGVRLTTGYCWRMHPAARELKRLITSGVLGRIISAEGRCAAGKLQRYIDGKAAWILDRARSGGGPMYNLGVHWIDLLRWLLDDEVVEVSGRNVKVNEQYDIEDNSFAHLGFRSGAVASLDISYTVPDSFPHGRDLHIGVRGTLGAVSWSPAYEGEMDVLEVCSDHPDFDGSARRGLSFDLEAVQGYSGYMGLRYVEDFAEAVSTGRAPAISGEDGVAALEVVEAVYLSDERGCRVEVGGE